MSKVSRGFVAVSALAVMALGLSPAEAVQGGTADGGSKLPLCPKGVSFTATPGTNANPYFPLNSALEGTFVGPDSDGTTHGLQMTLGGFERVGSVRTRVVEELEWQEITVDGVRDAATEPLIEDSFNYFAQSLADTTVCYFGERVDSYKDGVLDNHNGSWRADNKPLFNCIGDQPNQPGIQMPAKFQQGARYQQESADCAKDVAQISDVSATDVTTKEGSLIETGAKEYKTYAFGKGLIDDDGLQLCTPNADPNLSNCGAGVANGH